VYAQRVAGPRSSLHPEQLVPIGGALVVAATVAWGLAATAAGHDLGTASAPLLYRFSPGAAPAAAVAVAVLAAAVTVAPRLRTTTFTPWRFAAAAFVLGLTLRLGLGVARTGVEGLWAVYEVPGKEGASEYLPALPAFDLGARFFLDTFAQMGTSLTVNAVGHPPGLLLTLHALGIDSAKGMAALTIAVGGLSVPLVYALGRRLTDERTARAATLLYVFAPAAVLHGATSADALYASLAVVAMIALAGHGSRNARGLRNKRGLTPRVAARVAGPAALAAASFFSWANLGVGALMAFIALRRDGVRSAAGLAIASAVGLVAFYGILHLATGFDPVGAVRAAESVYREGVASHRPYAFWVLGAPAAFLIAAGLPIAWLGLRALGAGETVALALFAVLAISAVLGFTKAETERIYLFLVPPLCIAAATVLPERWLGPTLTALACQALATELLFYTVW